MNSRQENELARIVQEGFPVTERPFDELAQRMQVSADQVLQTLKGWRKRKLLREISAVMEGSRIGYESALVCGAVPASEMDRVASIISDHPLVTHNYERRHFYNLWFTIAAPKTDGVERHVRALERLTGYRPFYILRRRHTFKIGVVFDMIERCNRTEERILSVSEEEMHPCNSEQRIIRAIQSDLPLTSRPFQALAEANDLEEDDLLQFIKNQSGRCVRKYVATFHHRRLGVSCNAMTCWRVDEQSIKDVGALMRKETTVSHCYSRDVAPAFLYNLYTMLHGPNRAFVASAARRLADRSGCRRYIMLESTREFKKTRLRYFTAAERIYRERYGELMVP